MNKKEYIKPELMIEEFDTEVLMLVVSGDKIDTETDQLSNSYRGGRRGQWGNLWYTED